MRRGLSRDSRGKVLGEASWNFSMFEERYKHGWRFSVRLVEDGGLLFATATGGHIELLMIRKHGELVFPSVEDDLHVAPIPGDRVLTFGFIAPPAMG